MDWTRYRFRSVWLLAAPTDRVLAVLERAEEYPRWWPQVREVAAGGERSGTARFRSALPYDLRVTARETRADRAAGVLEIAMAGDLEGWARWTVAPRDPPAGGSRAVFEQDVRLRAPGLRRLAVVGRPLFRANHALMMRAGCRGLRTLPAEAPGEAV